LGNGWSLFCFEQWMLVAWRPGENPSLFGRFPGDQVSGEMDGDGGCTPGKLHADQQ